MRLVISLERTDPPEGVLTVDDGVGRPQVDGDGVPFEGWLELMSALERALAKSAEAYRGGG